MPLLLSRAARLLLNALLLLLVVNLTGSSGDGGEKLRVMTQVCGTNGPLYKF